jgi:putative redox protein
MKASVVWSGQKMRFETHIEQHIVPIDARSPIGESSAPTPKELLIAAVCGCTAMDVAALMRKHKQPVSHLEVTGDADLTDTQPKVFKSMVLTFKVDGEGVSTEKVLEAVQLSQTLYCGVSAMVVKACPIRYTVLVNGKEVGQGVAKFSI